MRKFNDICYSKHRNKLDIYLPEKNEFDLLIYFHGGGLGGGDKDEILISCPALLSRDIAIVSANYRLYPEFEYPDFLYDAAEAVEFVYEHISEYGKCKKMFIGGSSAGAYLAMMLCFDKKYLGLYGLSAMNVNGFIFDAGQPTKHYTILRATGCDERKVIIDESSALYHVGEDEKYPSMLFIVSDNDIPNRYEQTMLLISTLKAFGHMDVKLKLMKNSTHCLYTYDTSRNDEYTKVIADFICEAK